MRAIMVAMLGVAALGLSAAAGGAQAGTLDDIRVRGKLLCAANTITGFAMPDHTGRWSGMMVDLCRALAVAVLSDSKRVEIVPVESKTRFSALADGVVDVLSDGTTVTLERDAAMGFSFPAIWLYDGQGFMTRSGGMAAISQIDGGTICVPDGTTNRKNLDEYIRKHALKARMVVTHSDEGGWASFIKGRCDVITGDRIGLINRNIALSEGAKDFALLPEVISKEPLGPVVRAGDDQWFKVVRWVVAALIAAEERGVTAANVGSISAEDAELAALTGQGPDQASSLGLEPGWARRVIAEVGNYGEIFDRHLGQGSAARSPRGQNALWVDGGLMYAPPFR